VKAIKVIVVALFSICLLTACVSTPPAPSEQYDAQAKLNEYRRSVGVPELNWDYELERMAQDWANWLCVIDARTDAPHRNLYEVLDAQYGWWWYLGENISWGSPSRLTNMTDAVVVWWERFPAHKAGMLLDYTQYVGIAINRCANGVNYVVANFGQK